MFCLRVILTPVLFLGFMWVSDSRSGGCPLLVDQPAERFAIGVEYIIPGFAEVYARTGVRWAKAAQGIVFVQLRPSAE